MCHVSGVIPHYRQQPLQLNVCLLTSPLCTVGCCFWAWPKSIKIRPKQKKQKKKSKSKICCLFIKIPLCVHANFVGRLCKFHCASMQMSSKDQNKTYCGAAICDFFWALIGKSETNSPFNFSLKNHLVIGQFYFWSLKMGVTGCLKKNWQRHAETDLTT